MPRKKTINVKVQNGIDDKYQVFQGDILFGEYQDIQFAQSTAFVIMSTLSKMGYPVKAIFNYKNENNGRTSSIGTTQGLS